MATPGTAPVNVPAEPADFTHRARAALARHRPTAASDPKAALAAVALVLSCRPDPSILLVRRRERAGDPWSGHMALPGGFNATSDASLAVTAARETREEAGIDLDRCGAQIGVLSDVAPQSALLPRVIVRPFVFAATTDCAPVAGEEVEEVVWLRVADMFSDASRKPLTLQFPTGARTFTSIQVEGYVIWGLTERILGEFASVVGL